jgi:uncharacterized protein (DUF1810 family)
MAGDPFDLQRFVEAQSPVIDAVRAELRAGRKRSHWMWFVFPQLAGLGASPMARHYAIASADEAHAYLAHPVLGPRLVECSNLVQAHAGGDIAAIFGSPDDRKFHSCMTLFDAVSPVTPAFSASLDAFFGGRRDERTLDLLRQAPGK